MFNKIMFSVSLLFIAIAFPLNASAVDVECKYGSEENGYTVTLLTDGTLTPKPHGSQYGYYPVKTSLIIMNDLLDSATGKYYCPPTIYYEQNFSGSARTGQSNVSFREGDYKSSATKYAESITGEEPAEADKFKTCAYYTTSGPISVNYNSSIHNIITSLSSTNTILDFTTLDDFKNGCPPDIYVLCGAGYCRVDFAKFDGSVEIDDKDPNADDETDDSEANSGWVVSENGEPINCSDLIYTDAETGKTVDLVNDLFSIIMIIAPILLIIFGSIDFAKATLASDEQAFKKAGKDFGKRAIAAILLFILPLLINIILGVAVDAGIFTDTPEICINQE